MIRRTTLAAASLSLAVLISPLRAGEAAPKYGPPGAPIAVPLSASNRYFRAAGNPAPDFWALIPFYVPQHNPYSCSAASVVAVVNAAKRLAGPLSDEAKNATQADILKKVSAERWPERLSRKGAPAKSPPKHGVTLEQLEKVLAASLKAEGLDRFEQATQRVEKADESALQLLRLALAGNERSSRDFMLVHFAQDELTGAPGGPYAHISPVGAYDEQARRVLILDVDRDWYEPYWVPDRALLEAMSKETPAFGRGGYTRVTFRDLPKPSGAQP